MSVVRVGLIGYGYWGTNLARNVATTPMLRLAAVAEAEATCRARAIAEHPAVPVHDDPEALLARDDIDAVMLATPASTHGELGMEALRTGRHLFVEKPLALDRKTAGVLVDEAARRARVLMVGHTYLYSPAVVYLRQLVEAGVFGDLRYLHSQRLLGQARPDCGVHWDLASHDVSIILYLLGERPAQVSARAFCHLDIEHHDTCFANLVFPSGIDASIHVSWVNPTKVRLLTAVGTERMAVYDDVPLDGKITLHDVRLDDIGPGPSPAYAQIPYRTGAGASHVPSLPVAEPLRQEVEAFSRACALGCDPLSGGAFGLDVVAVVEAAQESVLQAGHPVTVDWGADGP